MRFTHRIQSLLRVAINTANSPKTPFYLYCFFYLVSFFPILLVQGHFWDDWVWFNTKDRLQVLTELGRPYMIFWIAPFDKFLDPISGPRIMTLISYFVAGVYIKKLLMLFPKLNLNSTQAWLIGTITTMAPLNFARVTNSINHYVFSFLAFTLGLYLFLKWLDSSKPRHRRLSLALFAFSFTTNSFLAVYLLIPLALHLKHSFKTFWKNTFKIWDFLVLPIIFLAVNRTLFPPFGEYFNYNKLAPGPMLEGAFKTPKSILYNYGQMLQLRGFDSQVSLWVCLPVLAIVALYLFTRKDLCTPNSEGLLKRLKYLLVSLSLLFIFNFLSLFPYLAIGHWPTQFGWMSRDQLVLQFFVGISIYLGFQLLPWQKARTLLISIIVAVFVGKNFVVYSEYIKDAHSQFSIVENLKTNYEIKNHNYFILADQKKPYQTLERYIRPYEINHMFKLAFENQKRYSLTYPYTWKSLNEVHELARTIELTNTSKDVYGANHFKYFENQDILWIYILPGEKRLSQVETYSLALKRLFFKEDYNKDVAPLTRLETKLAKDLNPWPSSGN